MLAPAFGFLSEWLNRLGTDMVKEWESSGYLKVYHYGEMRSLPLHYPFVQDIEQYDEAQLQRQVPTLIIHGRNDEVIPIQSSRNYAKQRPWVKLVEVDSDHSLTNVSTKIWSLTKEFCHL
ncbi:YqiA/YcfP family alpha/beta fold hydrolase [Chroococcus sp. FPU101]|uniref:YqiA/YcfP family alpha/beta fold hydrolase n=1 Tax=Chroococcus sp. FPU101 TaxID=1974212 RepID=UPI0035ABDA2D